MPTEYPSRKPEAQPTDQVRTGIELLISPDASGAEKDRSGQPMGRVQVEGNLHRWGAFNVSPKTGAV